MDSNTEVNMMAAFDLRNWSCFVEKENFIGGVKEERKFFCFSLDWKMALTLLERVSAVSESNVWERIMLCAFSTWYSSPMICHCFITL